MPQIHTPAYTLMVLKLADDFDVFAFLSEHCSHSVYIGCFADEGSKDHIDSLLHTKLQILDILLRNSRKIYSSPGEVHSLLAAQGATILNFTIEVIRTWREEREKEILPDVAFLQVVNTVQCFQNIPKV